MLPFPNRAQRHKNSVSRSSFFLKRYLLKSDQPNRLNFNEGPNLVEILFKLFLQMFDLLNEIEKIPYGSAS